MINDECSEAIDTAKDLIAELDELDAPSEKILLADGIIKRLSDLSFQADFVNETNDKDLRIDYFIAVNALRTYCSSLELGDLKLNSAFNRIQEGIPDYDLSFNEDGIVTKPEDLTI